MFTALKRNDDIEFLIKNFCYEKFNISRNDKLIFHF